MRSRAKPAGKKPLNILLVGSGGREHAIAWKLSQSPRLAGLWIAPGNAGTTTLGNNVSISADDIPTLVSFAREKSIDLVMVGPELPLDQGLSDALQATGVLVFGPTRAAAQIETSKAFAKGFMQRHDIPTARYAAFSDHAEAATYLQTVDYPVVLKASGLAGGKGVLLPETREAALQDLASLMVTRSLGAAGAQVVIEERLEGEEVSLLAFTDGVTVSPLPPAQDHKRLLEGDQGPNTGGMGAYAPAPACPPGLVQELTRTVLQPAVDGLRVEGYRYCGVLYAGLMLTSHGPYVLEFNCRFGDPETQVLLPLLESDLVDIAEACALETLWRLPIQWKSGACACVVLASAGYPGHYETGKPISGLDKQRENSLVFHAGTRVDGNQVTTAGGRVLGVPAWADDLPQALQLAQEATDGINFEGRQYRKDIGRRGLRHVQTTPGAYTRAGVSIDAGNQAVKLMTSAVRSTYNPAVLAGIGSFGGLYDASALKAMRHPVLVASTDGVGTKIMLAARAGRYLSIGQDIVNHCINDVLVQGARPLFFLDYFASSHLEPPLVAEIVRGIALACSAASCPLIGGETAEMPGVYQPGQFDLAGTLVGLVENEQRLPRLASIRAGDLLLGLRSSGPHTNGYSLLRRIFENTPLDAILPGMERPLVDILLEPHRSYLPLLIPLLDQAASPIKALAHITGGGLLENIPRSLPSHLTAHIQRGSWPVPALYPLVQEMGSISDDEMPRVFNLGIGMVAVIDPSNLQTVQQVIPEETWVIGRLIPGEPKVVIDW